MIPFPRLSLVVLLLLPFPAWASDGHRIDIMFDTSGSMKHVKQPLVSTVQTLAWSLVLASQQDQIDDVSLSLSGFCNNAEQIRLAGLDVFDTRQWPDAAKALTELGRQCSGAEDGLNALDAALRARPEAQPGHLLLITDEHRSKVHDKIEQTALLKLLYERQLVLDAMVAVQLRCADGRRALGLTDRGIGYVMTESGAFDQCTGARIESARRSTVSDYATIAIASGGSVWDITALQRHGQRGQDAQKIMEAIAQSYTSAVLNRARWASRPHRFMARPFASALRVPIGETVTLDGRQSLSAHGDQTLAEWYWDTDGDRTPDHYGPDGFHTFQASGFFPLTLYVVDGNGEKDSSTLWIEVYDP